MPRVLDYQPRGAAFQLFRCKAPEILISGPAGTGKSRGVLEYLWRTAGEYPGCRIGLMRKTRVSMTETVLNTFEELVVPAGNRCLRGPTRANRRNYVCKNGSEFLCLGMDEPTRIFSMELDILYWNECTEGTLQEWESLHRALRWKHLPQPDGTFLHQLIGDCNPGPPQHWILKRCHRGITKHLISQHKDNPSLTSEYLHRLDTQLTGVTRDRLYLGLWVGAEGMIFPEFNEATHVLKRPPGTWKWAQLGIRWFFASMDWGYHAPGCLQVWAVDGDERMILVREVYRVKQSREWWANKLAALDDEFHLKAVVADPEDPEAIVLFRDYLRAKNAPGLVHEAKNSVVSGIEHMRRSIVQKRLLVLEGYLESRDPELDDSGAPCSFLEEIPAFVYPIAEDGKPIREEPAKGIADHSMDAARYACMFAHKRDFLQRERVPSFPRGSFGDILGHKAILKRSQRR